MTCEVCFSQVLEINLIDLNKFATFSNSAFVMNYSFNMDSKLDRSVEGLLVLLKRPSLEEYFHFKD